MAETIRLKLNEAVVRGDLYPRATPDAGTVQVYVENIEALPPIEVNQDNILIDGMHRLEAFRAAGAKVVDATVTPTAGDHELLMLAVRRNASHGYQLTKSDKRAVARRVYEGVERSNRAAMKRELAGVMSVTVRTVANWVEAIDAEDALVLQGKVAELQTEGKSQEQIAEELEVSRSVVRTAVKALGRIGKFSEIARAGSGMAGTPGLEFHPLSEIWPPMGEREFEWLKWSMSEIGMLRPILLHGGRIIDGRHRYLAAKELGMEDIPTVELADLGHFNTRKTVVCWNILRPRIEERELRRVESEIAAGFDARSRAELPAFIGMNCAMRHLKDREIKAAIAELFTESNRAQRQQIFETYTDSIARMPMNYYPTAIDLLLRLTGLVENDPPGVKAIPGIRAYGSESQRAMWAAAVQARQDKGDPFDESDSLIGRYWDGPASA